MIPHLMLAALLAAGAAKKAKADEFAPIQVGEGVTYPLPAVPLPALQPVAAANAAGGWTETQDSPALRVSRAWMKLGQASAVERSDGTKRNFQHWRQEVSKSGAYSKSAQAAQANFLASYSRDLRSARKIYEGVIEDLDSMSGDAAAPGGQEAPASTLAREADEQLKESERDVRLTDAACFLSPDTCVPPDAGDKALEDEVASLMKGTLDEGGPDGSLSVRSLRRKARLLALRSRVMLAVTQRAAARLATDVASAQDGAGPKSLISPLGPQSPTRGASYRPSDPYK